MPGDFYVRSKSERSIADMLTEADIPFRYEPELVIGAKRYYPDFMILCSDGSIVIWEHFGMTDDSEYFHKMCKYTDIYQAAIDTGDMSDVVPDIMRSGQGMRL